LNSVLGNCVFDIAVVPEGTVSKNKKKFVEGDKVSSCSNLKRTHSFESNGMSRSGVNDDTVTQITTNSTVNAGSTLPRTPVS
jgi:hypothetical protein